MKNAAFDTSFVVAAKQHAGAFIAEITGVLGVVFATVDGFDITHSTLPGLDASRVAATASSISAIGSAVTSEFDMGASRNVSIRTEHGFVFILNGHSPRAVFVERDCRRERRARAGGVSRTRYHRVAAESMMLR
jgi:predicted regulator of Ras-like GTPase activity (Roadblock/LC7/MglB family)